MLHRIFLGGDRDWCTGTFAKCSLYNPGVVHRLGIPGEPTELARLPRDDMPSFANLVFYFYGVRVTIRVLVFNLNVVAHLGQSVFEECTFVNAENDIEHRY